MITETKMEDKQNGNETKQKPKQISFDRFETTTKGNKMETIMKTNRNTKTKMKWKLRKKTKPKQNVTLKKTY